MKNDDERNDDERNDDERKYVADSLNLRFTRTLGSRLSYAHNGASPENASGLSPPPKFAWTGPPKFSKRWNHVHFARHLYVFWSSEGASLGLWRFF